MVIYHPTIPDPQNDWTFIGLRPKEEMQVRQELKRVQDWEIADGKPTGFQDRYLRWIKKKSWVFIRFLFFF